MRRKVSNHVGCVDFDMGIKDLLHIPIAYLGDELEVDGVPLLLALAADLALLLELLPEDVLVEDEPVLVPLGQEVARDLHRVLDVVDLAHVEPVETSNTSEAF